MNVILEMYWVNNYIIVMMVIFIMIIFIIIMECGEVGYGSLWCEFIGFFNIGINSMEVSGFVINVVVRIIWIMGNLFIFNVFIGMVKYYGSLLSF